MKLNSFTIELFVLLQKEMAKYFEIGHFKNVHF
jgi:hypothetical protein